MTGLGAPVIVVEGRFPLRSPEAECAHLIEEVSALARANGAVSGRASRDEAERLAFRAGRKAAIPAVGRLGPDYCMDGAIPRRRMPEVLARMGEMSKAHGLVGANVFHAGDGNLHPLILYDLNVLDELERAEAFGSDILRMCVEVGVLTGEHGVGSEKRDLMGEMLGPDPNRTRKRA